MTATPVSESTDERLTLTGAVYQPLEHGALLQAIEDVGGVWSATDGGGCIDPPMTSCTVFTTVPFAPVFKTPAQWNSYSQVGTDIFADVSFKGFTPASGSAAANAGGQEDGVFFDYYGNARPANGPISAGERLAEL